MKKSSWVTWAIAAVIIIAALLVSNKPENTTSEELAKCIGENSILYVQLGCPHCKTQEDMFGENKKYLNKVDCFFEGGKCENITATPTWEINGERHTGIQKIDKLKKLTRC
ncbi:MAG: hypothetical protein AABW50_05395 [Nanoarchaeota archaeon]